MRRVSEIYMAVKLFRGSVEQCKFFLENNSNFYHFLCGFSHLKLNLLEMSKFVSNLLMDQNSSNEIHTHIHSIFHTRLNGCINRIKIWGYEDHLTVFEITTFQSIFLYYHLLKVVSAIFSDFFNRTTLVINYLIANFLEQFKFKPRVKQKKK